MTVRQSMVALLAERPMYGAQLKAEFEGRTGNTWPLNVGQVYTTLTRLERDGLVESRYAPDDEGRTSYRLTPAGRREASRWWQEPVAREQAPRSELAIKLALAVTIPAVDVAAVVQTQRSATITHLQDLTRLKRHRGADVGHDGLAWALVLENLIFNAEAEVRWLDHVEAMLARHPGPASVAIAPAETDRVGDQLQEQR